MCVGYPCLHTGMLYVISILINTRACESRVCVCVCVRVRVCVCVRVRVCERVCMCHLQSSDREHRVAQSSRVSPSVVSASAAFQGVGTSSLPSERWKSFSGLRYTVGKNMNHVSVINQC